ncbi:MAG: flavin monoamine oxidase family protein [Xanthobacteraceae bacterium]
MQGLSRRNFLAGVGAATAAPAAAAPRPVPQQAGPPASGNVDAVIVGAGAAGIAAARRLAAAGKRFALLEASEQVGGRCLTDTTTFGVPYDRGAHWIYAADLNPIARLAVQTGVELYPAPAGQRMRLGRRYAREGEMEDFLATLVRANTAIADSARRADAAAAQVLPKDLGDWRSTIDFLLGPYACGKDLAEVSAVDLTRSPERENSVFCRAGFGALLAKLVPPQTVQLATPVTRIAWGSWVVQVETARGQFQARAVIVTASTNAVTSGKLRFAPDLPKRHLDAFAKLRLGSRERVALELAGNPLGLRADELVFEKSENKQTAAIFANISGSSVCTIDVGGSFGRDLAGKGDAALIDFAISWLGKLYGSDIKAAVNRRLASRWSTAPWVLGAMSVAAPGAQSARKIIMEPLGNRIFFAGEAAHETFWGTVGGAWESGERAADAVLKLLGGRRS